MNTIATSGNKGKGVRSDCYVNLEITKSGGIKIILESKVEVMFGKANKELITGILNFFEIKNAKITVEDSGALPFVISARVEATIKNVIDSKKEFLLPFISQNNYKTAKDCNRISRLYLPGNSPSLMINAGVHKPDGIILDLEDAVAPNKKFEARFLVRNALRNIDFYSAERMVRINQVPKGLDDLDFIIPHNVNLILVPKCESAEQIHRVNSKINEIKTKCKINDEVWIIPISKVH